MKLIYLDNAATSFPKPLAVYDAVNQCMRHYCGNAGRSSHALAVAAGEKIYECRTQIADYFGASAPEQVVFTLNATYAINLMIKGLLRPGDHVLISDMEHNAVLRPIVQYTKERGITYDVFPTMVDTQDAQLRRNAVRICAGIAKRLKPNTRAVICSHQSNLCSVALPLTEIGNFCHRHGLLLLVDASQSAGHLPIHMEHMHIDGLCAPAHKGLYGIQGCGFAIFPSNIQPSTLIEGGSGYRSLDMEMPQELPERIEAGTLPTPAIVGLSAGLQHLSQFSMDDIRGHEQALFSMLVERLQAQKQYHVYLPQFAGSTLLFHRHGTPADHIGQLLHRQGICVRTGYHCAALGHQTLQTPPGGGVRVSFGLFNTPRDVEVLFQALRSIEDSYELPNNKDRGE